MDKCADARSRTSSGRDARRGRDLARLAHAPDPADRSRACCGRPRELRSICGRESRSTESQPRAHRGCGMCKGGFKRGPQTFARREEVVAVGPPTGESNPVASGRSGGEVPTVGVSHHPPRISRRAPSANRAGIGGMGAGMVHGTYRLRSRVERGVEAVLSTCSDVESTTSSPPWACAQRLAERLEVWRPRESQGSETSGGE